MILEAEEDDTPKPDYKPPPVVPREENKTGPNKKTYFVCNDRKFNLISYKLTDVMIYHYYHHFLKAATLFVYL